MPRPKTDRCVEPDCDEKRIGTGKNQTRCEAHYAEYRERVNARQRARKGGSPRRKPNTERPAVPPVVPDASWPDTHRHAPSGSWLVRWTCPACGRSHLTAYNPSIEPEPGVRIGSCREKSASGNAALPVVHLMAVPESRRFDAEP